MTNKPMTNEEIAWQKRILECPEFDCPWRNSTVCYGCQSPEGLPPASKSEVLDRIRAKMVVASRLVFEGEITEGDLVNEAFPVWQAVISEELDLLYAALKARGVSIRFLQKGLQLEIEGRHDLWEANKELRCQAHWHKGWPAVGYFSLGFLIAFIVVAIMALCVG